MGEMDCQRGKIGWWGRGTRTLDPMKSQVNSLIKELLNQLATLGQTAQALKLALCTNGHRPDTLKAIKELLQHQPNK
jgi:hypothetical protein